MKRALLSGRRKADCSRRLRPHDIHADNALQCPPRSGITVEFATAESKRRTFASWRPPMKTPRCVLQPALSGRNSPAIPQARIAVILPDVASVRSQLERIFLSELAPELLTAGETRPRALRVLARHHAQPHRHDAYGDESAPLDGGHPAAGRGQRADPLAVSRRCAERALTRGPHGMRSSSARQSCWSLRSRWHGCCGSRSCRPCCTRNSAALQKLAAGDARQRKVPCQQATPHGWSMPLRC